MKKIIFSTGLLALLLWSCTESDTSQEQKSTPLSMAGLELQMTEHPEWAYENLRLYPICADE
ncbi:MAG: hypothetical protein H6574_18245, partial [Lewinellaceae bacterium]|nr:hypothetical protein [Lewinellaceae bacterium]